MYCIVGHAEDQHLVSLKLARINTVEAQETGYQDDQVAFPVAIPRTLAGKSDTSGVLLCLRRGVRRGYFLLKDHRSPYLLAWKLLYRVKFQAKQTCPGILCKTHYR